MFVEKNKKGILLSTDSSAIGCSINDVVEGPCCFNIAV